MIFKFLIFVGAPREKLVMGVPFYGRSFTLADANNHNVGAAHMGRGMAGKYSVEPGIVGFNELCEIFQKQPTQWNLEWENNQMVPYAYSGRQWIGYENEKSIALKADYVKKENLGGIMIWSIESDDFRGVCGTTRYPLLTIINEVLNGNMHMDLNIEALTTSRTQTEIKLSILGNDQICQGKQGYVRDAVNCGKFYFCDHNEMFSFECPQSLYFDLKSLSCNYAYLVKC